MRKTLLLSATLLAFASAVQAQSSLSELYGAALRSNPVLQLRQFDVERAHAEVDGARSRLLPQVVAQAALSSNEFRDSAGEQKYGGKRASISARQALYDAGSSRRVEASQSTVVQREQELAQTRLVLLGELLDRYLQALAAQDELSALAAETRAATRHVDRMRALRERQMVRVTDQLEARAYLQTLVTRTIDAGNEHAVALARLSELTGFAVGQVNVLSRTAFDQVTGTQEDLLAAVRRSHPRLLALAKAIDAARSNLEASRAEHQPQLTATLAHVNADQGFDNRRSPPYHATSVGIELRVPLYEGGRVNAQIRDAVARLGAAEQQLEAVRREVEREALSQWLSVQANHARIASTEAEVQAFAESVQAQESGYELGASRITDVLDARRKLLKARADQAKARYDFVRDIVGLKIRTGAVSEANLVEWDRWFTPSAR